MKSNRRSRRYDIVVVNRTRQRLPLAFIHRVAATTLRTLGVRDAHIGIAFVGRSTMARLAARTRPPHRAANVLSFRFGSTRGVVRGDILLCPSVIRREAGAYERTPRVHLAMLLIHGMVHLGGYTHDRARRAEQMERMERRIGMKLGLLASP